MMHGPLLLSVISCFKLPDLSFREGHGKATLAWGKRAMGTLWLIIKHVWQILFCQTLGRKKI